MFEISTRCKYLHHMREHGPVALVSTEILRFSKPRTQSYMYVCNRLIGQYNTCIFCVFNFVKLHVTIRRHPLDQKFSVHSGIVSAYGTFSSVSTYGRYPSAEVLLYVQYVHVPAICNLYIYFFNFLVPMSGGC